MARGKTAKETSHMQGDKPYHKYARAALPLLVRQAKARKPITYGSLAKELGMPNARNLDYPLGSIGTSLQRLGEEWRRCCMIQLRREWGRFSNFSFRTPQRRIAAYRARPSG